MSPTKQLTKRKKSPKLSVRFSQWLEKKWAAPSYGGWVLIIIGLCFFGAATNTMAGWLYVLSGIMFALLIVSAFLSRKALQKIKIRRYHIAPVSVGEELTLELDIHNSSYKAINLIQITDLIPSFLCNKPQAKPIEFIPPRQKYSLNYSFTPKQRGVYQWHNIQLRTGTPFGLFWCRRIQKHKAKAIVYPQVLPLKRCPLIEQIGQDDSTRLQSQRLYQKANEGLTRALRQYRQGDPTRLIHWKSSAKFGELQVRELEIVTGGEEVIICLDTASPWHSEDFESAVIAAASLYIYGSRQQMNIKLWTAKTGLIHGNWVVLETLAKTQPQEISEESFIDIPKLPLIWITQNNTTLNTLPYGSRWILFPTAQSTSYNFDGKALGLTIDPEISLQNQLQKYF